jgi:hypothetical protein
MAPTKSSEEALIALLAAFIPSISDTSKSVIAKLVRGHGRLVSADVLARSLGLRTRHQLRHTLMSDHLPTPRELAAWIRIFLWMIEYEEHRTAIARAALEEGQDPSIRYRLVRRITGLDWTEARKRGSTWLLVEFLTRYGHLRSAATGKNERAG